MDARRPAGDEFIDRHIGDLRCVAERQALEDPHLLGPHVETAALEEVASLAADQADAEKARKEPLVVASRSNAAHIFAGEYFAEEVRRDILERYGEKKLYEGGLSVRTTLDPKLQVMARKTVAAGLVNFDEAQGWRGAMSKLDISGDWGVKLAEVKSLGDISPWRMAVVLETSEQSARIGFQPGRELGGAISKDRQTGLITLEGVRWAKVASASTRARTPIACASGATAVTTRRGR